MHEYSLMADLLNKVCGIAREHNSPRVVRVRVILGALAHISAAHFREHFEEFSRSTPAEGARLDIEVRNDVADPHAQEIRLAGVEVQVVGAA